MRIVFLVLLFLVLLFSIEAYDHYYDGKVNGIIHGAVASSMEVTCFSISGIEHEDIFKSVGIIIGIMTYGYLPVVDGFPVDRFTLSDAAKIHEYCKPQKPEGFHT
jgi:hypothetical protein